MRPYVSEEDWKAMPKKPDNSYITYFKISHKFIDFYPRLAKKIQEIKNLN